MIARTLSLPLLALSILFISGCSTTGSSSSGKNWGKCSVLGGAVWGIPGAAHSLATGGISLAAGALISGLACANEDPNYVSNHKQNTKSGALPLASSDDVLRDPDLPANAARVQFEFDSATLSEAGKDMLDAYLEGHSDASFSVTGHTCDIGSSTYNQGLSVRRANSVKHYLMQKNISGSKIETVGKGESEPLYPNSSDENRMKNRRVEIRLMH
ncbi:OmpA family protein [Endozoicomonas sp. Mp262]|uniref:OmpA family protein n=1 Tax=Endozoicomonas sp. Mp262 TaxID=2919499 RepID=UPI0021E09F8B